MKLQPYIMFNGNAREAIDFYTQALGGQVTFIQNIVKHQQTIKRSCNKWSHHACKYQMRGYELMIADAHPARTVTFGEAINISIATTSKEEWQKLFDALANGGKIDMPYVLQFWGAIFGSVTDKFGVSWMVNAEQNKTLLNSFYVRTLYKSATRFPTLCPRLLLRHFQTSLSSVVSVLLSIMVLSGLWFRWLSAHWSFISKISRKRWNIFSSKISSSYRVFSHSRSSCKIRRR